MLYTLRLRLSTPSTKGESSVACVLHHVLCNIPQVIYIATPFIHQPVQIKLHDSGALQLPTSFVHQPEVQVKLHDLGALQHTSPLSLWFILAHATTAFTDIFHYLTGMKIHMFTNRNKCHDSFRFTVTNDTPQQHSCATSRFVFHIDNTLHTVTQSTIKAEHLNAVQAAKDHVHPCNHTSTLVDTTPSFTASHHDNCLACHFAMNSNADHHMHHKTDLKLLPTRQDKHQCSAATHTGLCKLDIRFPYQAITNNSTDTVHSSPTKTLPHTRSHCIC
jgi:hypothetical protein